VATVFPLFFLTRRLFGARAAVWAGLGLAAWGLHIQLSTTAGSEALSLLLVLGAVALLARAREEGSAASLLAAALCLNLGCATRYDVWLLVPLGALGLAWGRGTPGLRAAALLAVACLPFPVAWLLGNAARGDALAPFRAIEAFHRAWAGETAGTWGEPLARLIGAGVFPGVALVTLTPLVGAWGGLGLFHAARRRRDVRWLAALIGVPTLYFSVRAGLLFDFVPLARFAVNPVALLLPFVREGFLAVSGGWGRAARGALLGATALLLVAIPAAVGLATYRQEGGLRDSLRPVSPISTNPPALMALARELGARLGPREGTLLLDSDGAYSDRQSAFVSRLPEARLIRSRWPDARQRRARAPPRYLLLLPDGALERVGDVRRMDGGSVELDGQGFVLEPGIPPPYRLYRREGVS
jgi:4-amino-4-deoxy-L-arabinose transferase-like glycosyltransferase